MGLPDMSTTPLRLTATIFAVAVLCLASAARAANYNETVNGDLSGTPATPTPWLLQADANPLVGAAGKSAASSDYDLVAFTVPAGHVLTSLVLNSHVLDASSSSFLGLQAGAVWTTGLGGQVSGDTLIGWEVYDSSYIGANLLISMGQNAESFNPGNGIVPPLAAGTYTMLLQDTGGAFTYGFTLNVAPVPEPAGFTLAGLAFIALAKFRSRR
jgi:hypothetical protein